MQKYIMIGTKTITKEIFRNVLRPLNNYRFLPTGGFWASPYNEYTISPWFNYLIDNSNDYLSKKDIHSASIFTLKDDTKILTITNYEKLKKITEKYPSYHHLLNFYKEQDNRELSINYELLSKDYDGIYVNYKNFEYNLNTIIFNKWAVNTLLLFNLDAIDSYISANIKFYLPGSFSYFNLEEEQNNIIKEESIYHKELYNYIELIFNELVSIKKTFNDYDDYFSHLIECTKKSIHVILNNKLYLSRLIKETLEKENIMTTEYIIIRNITTNVLSNYLKNNINEEKKLPKTKIKKPREYPIEENTN